MLAVSWDRSAICLTALRVHVGRVLFPEDDVVGGSLPDAGRGDEREPGVCPKLLQRQRTATAHRGDDLAHRQKMLPRRERLETFLFHPRI